MAKGDGLGPGFTSQNYQNALLFDARAKKKFGSSWMDKDLYSLMDDPFESILADPYQLKNTSSKGRWLQTETRDSQGTTNTRGAYKEFVPWGKDEGTAPQEAYWNTDPSQGPVSSGPEWESLYATGKGNPKGWDRNKYGNLEDYSDSSDPDKFGTLPDGTPVKDYLRQLEDFDWPNFASKPNDKGGLTPLKGFGTVLSAGLGSMAMGAGAVGAEAGAAAGGVGAGTTGSFAELLADIAAQDLTAGSSMFGSLAGAAGGAGVDMAGFASGGGNPFAEIGGGASMPDFTGIGTGASFDPSAIGNIGGLPGTPSATAAGGNWWDAFTGGGGNPFSTLSNGSSTLNDVANSFESNAGQVNPVPGGGASNPISNILRQLMGQGAGGTGSGNNGLAQLLGAGTGLFDLFSSSPNSASGINDAAAKVADPMIDDRAHYGLMLKNIMTNPGAFSLTPGAKFTLGTGTENLTRSNAAKGLLGSGNILADIMKYGEGVASTDYYTMIDKLTPLAGGTTGSPAVAGQIKSGALNNRNNALANIGGGLANPGNAASNGLGGILGSLGGIGSGISSILGLFS